MSCAEWKGNIGAECESIVAKKLFKVWCFILILHINFIFYSIAWCLLFYTWHPSPQPWGHSSKMYYIYQVTQVPPDMSGLCIPEFEKHDQLKQRLSLQALPAISPSLHPTYPSHTLSHLISPNILLKFSPIPVVSPILILFF